MKKDKQKKYRIILQVTKYGFILFLVLAISFSTVLIVYARRFDYSIPKKTEIEIYDCNGNRYLKMNNEARQSYIAIDDIDQKIIDAFISIEDKTFYTHSGINIKRIIGALASNIKSGEIVEGASTITQQYVKNTFLTSEKKLKRKIDEALIAIQIETKYSKDQILEGYLNTIYFDHGIYGIEDACRFYFNKSASSISLLEAATLASIPKSPSNYSPVKNEKANLERRNLVLKEMLSDGKISEQDYQENIAKEVSLYGKLLTLENTNAPYFQDIVINQLKKLNISDEQMGKGIKVYTTLDLKLNSLINEAIDKYYPEYSGLELAIYALDPTNGKVLSVVGGKDYLTSTYNRATSALRQPGSAIKPFLYYGALENGFTPATAFESKKTTFYYNDIEYSPRNFGDIYPNRDVSMTYALATSDNIYAVKTHLFLGTDVMANNLRRFGFTTPITNNPTLALGTSEVYLDELVTGYSKIASLGKDVTPYYITKITDLDDNIIYQFNPTFSQVFDKSTCFILSEAMTNVFDNNLAININTTCANIASLLTKKYAAKSGSTDYDNWIVGFNKNIVLGIWTGYDDAKVISNSITKYIKYIWAYVMERYNQNSDYWYDVPDNVIGITLNPTTGTIAKRNEYRKKLYFKTNTLPWFIYFT